MGLFFYTKIGSIISIGDLPTTNIIEPKIALTKAAIDQKGIKNRISSSLTELESSLDQVIGSIDKDLAGKFSNSVKEGVGRKKLELNALQEFCKTK